MNRLSNQTSAYLRSARHQPVHWYPWCAEAFDDARRLDRPILLDIGAVWCHWCHVMDSESYENEQVARLINEKFIAIKVDRDERPDVDARYQAAVSAMSGQGGWPLTAFLLPDGRVFYGGTYFPPEDRHGRPGLPRVLNVLADAYHNEREKLIENAGHLHEAIQHHLAAASDSASLDHRLIDSALNDIGRAYDARYGGFGGAPKFPHPGAIEFLLQAYDRTGEQWTIDVATTTLRTMARGGIFDQLVGGFHRYSTDERWIVPHFEKMLYDNAPLLTNYVHAYQMTRDEFFQDVATSIIRFVDTVLSDRQRGGFYASQDADVEPGDDGSSFTWTVDDAQKVLSSDEFAVLQLHYHLYERGEMHHDPRQNVLFVDKEVPEIASILKKSEAEVRDLLTSGKSNMLAARMRRKPPLVDTTIYSSWNGMMVAAYLTAFRGLGNQPARDFALLTLRRLLEEHISSDGLVTHRPFKVGNESFLDDQMEVAAALLEAFEVSADRKYLRCAESIVSRAIELFWDEEGGGFFDIPRTQEPLGALSMKNKPILDSPTPGGNAVAAMVLNRLYATTSNPDYRRRAEQTLRCFAGRVAQHGVFAATYFRALDDFLSLPPHVVVVARKDDPVGEELHAAALRTYRPGVTVMRVHPDSGDSLPPVVLPVVDHLTRATAFVCTDSTCAPPVHSVYELESTIKKFGRYGRPES